MWYRRSLCTDILHISQLTYLCEFHESGSSELNICYVHVPESLLISIQYYTMSMYRLWDSCFRLVSPQQHCVCLVVLDLYNICKPEQLWYLNMYVHIQPQVITLSSRSGNPFLLIEVYQYVKPLVVVLSFLPPFHLVWVCLSVYWISSTISLQISLPLSPLYKHGVWQLVHTFSLNILSPLSPPLPHLHLFFPTPSSLFLSPPLLSLSSSLVIRLRWCLISVQLEVVPVLMASHRSPTVSIEPPSMENTCSDPIYMYLFRFWLAPDGEKSRGTSVW